MHSVYMPTMIATARPVSLATCRSPAVKLASSFPRNQVLTNFPATGVCRPCFRTCGFHSTPRIQFNGPPNDDLKNLLHDLHTRVGELVQTNREMQRVLGITKETLEGMAKDKCKLSENEKILTKQLESSLSKSKEIVIVFSVPRGLGGDKNILLSEFREQLQESEKELLSNVRDEFSASKAELDRKAREYEVRLQNRILIRILLMFIGFGVASIFVQIDGLVWHKQQGSDRTRGHGNQQE
ncbi:hypothetical protein RU639_006148 [Aspergillus parasiticus]